MDHRTAGLMLYALQTASINLRKADFEASDATTVVIDRDDVYRTSIGGPQWFEEDFEEEEETDGEPDEEAPAAAAPVQSAATKPAAGTKEAGVKALPEGEARLKVQALVRNWLLESASENAAENPG